MSPQGRDPAENGPLGRYYRNWRPTLYGRLWTRLWSWATRLGLTADITTTLLVPERGTGRLVGHVLVPVSHEGRRYLVSMLGAGSNWVLDIEAAGGAAFLQHGAREAVRLTQLPPKERAPVLKAWAAIATSGRQHLPVAPDAPLAHYAAIAAHYPVFRVDLA